MGNARDEIDLAYRLLDLDLVDCEGRRCGKVDDIVLEGGPGELTYVSAVRTGPGALPARFIRRLRPLAERMLGGEAVTVPWKDVDDFDATLTLTETADELKLGQGDRRLSKLLGARTDP